MQEIIQIVKEAQKKSILMIGKLFTTFNLNPKDYMSIFKNIKFGETGNNEAAFFSCPDDMIIISSKYINIIKNSLEKTKDKEKLKQVIIDDLAKTIAHETIHASRVITSKEKVSSPFIAASELSEIHGIEDLDLNFKIVACYEDHDMNREEYNLDKNNNYKCTQIIDKQESLEECITEGLAQISSNLLKEDKSIDEVIEDIIQTPNMRPDTIVGAMIINNLNEDIVRWFLTTTYTGKYIDMLKEFFEEDYSKILDIAHKVFRIYLNSEFKNIEYEKINELEELLIKRSEKYDKTK